MRVVGLLEVLSYNAFEDCAVVLPTLDHALHYWPMLSDAYRRHHGREWVVVTKTAITSRRTNRVLRMWVRYERQPTMPMDFEKVRRNFRLLDLYGMNGKMPYGYF